VAAQHLAECEGVGGVEIARRLAGPAGDDEHRLERRRAIERGDHRDGERDPRAPRCGRILRHGQPAAARGDRARARRVLEAAVGELQGVLDRGRAARAGRRQQRDRQPEQGAQSLHPDIVQRGPPGRQRR